MPERRVDAAAFRELAEFIRFKSGIILDESKTYLVETRLGPLLDEFKLETYMELCRRAHSDQRVMNRLIDEISTNETSFFRDNSPFELLKFRLIPEVMDRLSGAHDQVKIWSAASSTGQEVYSIAIACREIIGPAAANRVRIVGTDISDSAVRRASMGSYSELELGRGLPTEYLGRYFRAEGARWKVSDELRAMASFKQMNLLENCGSIGSFDIVFCRNVAIYFDNDSRRGLFERIARQLRPHGALLIGSSETMIGVTNIFERRDHLRSAYYVVRL